MVAFLIILFILECGAFCFLFYQNLEIKKDIEILYDCYAKQLELVTKRNLSMRRENRM